MILRKFFGFLSVVLCFGLVSVSAQTQVPKLISGGVVNGKAVSLPKPEYPAAAAAVGAKGAVNVAVIIDEQGNVESAEAVSGHPLLRAAAVEAARQAKFAPTQLSGVLVKVKGIVIYNFNLSDKGSDKLSESDNKNQDRTSKFDPNEQVINGKAISLPKPEYPAAAQAVNASGVVVVKVIIDVEGNVTSAEAVSGHPLLRQSAEEAARNAKFKPTLLEGIPVIVKGNIVYNFGGFAATGLGQDSDNDRVSTNPPEFISGGILNFRATILPAPPFPAAARAAKAEGAVNVAVVVDEEGNVVEAQATSGHPILRAASVAAARKAKFPPTIIAGSPVKVRGIIIYNFNL